MGYAREYTADEPSSHSHSTSPGSPCSPSKSNQQTQAYHRDIVSLAIVSHTQILRADSVAVSQTGHVGSTRGRKTRGWAVTTDIIDSMILHKHNHDMIEVCAGRRSSLSRWTGWPCYLRDAGDAQAHRQR